MHIGLDLQLAPPQNLPPMKANLHNVLSVMLRTRRDPQNGPICATPLLAALAPCLQQSGNGFGPFTADRMECAGEFLTALLSAGFPTALSSRMKLESVLAVEFNSKRYKVIVIIRKP